MIGRSKTPMTDMMVRMRLLEQEKAARALRAQALALAIEATKHFTTTPEGEIKRAKIYETYLRGATQEAEEQSSQGG